MGTSSSSKVSKDKAKSSTLKKRSRKERPEVEADDENVSDHDSAWKEKNVEEIDKLDSEIKMLERNLGIRTDAKRKKRFFSRIEEEGLGLGIFDFLEDINKKVKMDARDYKAPDADYKFNDPNFEVAIGASDLEDNAAEVDPRDSDSEEVSVA